ncbi:hypothetical protein EDC96DRAFT_561066 [Choanephora cucurbitarum]|nr:hypothetical protein EDC96DRAFT_561066 [Choanephora cucurbitarum]
MSNLGALDMALDDVISQNRSNRRNNNNNNNKSNTRRSTGGGVNKNRSSGGRSPYGSRPARTNNTRSNPKPAASRASNSLVVANLHFNVTEKDLYDLFGQVGPLKRAFLHIGPNGKSAGIADVVFQSSHDAERARNTYNNVELDGRPMRITVASLVSAVATSAPSTRRSGPVRGGNNNNNRNSNGNRRNRNSRPKPSEEQLDADMDSYMGGSEDVQMN